LILEADFLSTTENPHRPGRPIKVVLSFTVPGRLEKPLLFVVLLYRRIRYGYPFRRIPLTRGKFAVVDPEDYPRLVRYKWYAHKSPHTFYAVRSLTNGKKLPRKNSYMHHLVIDIPPGLFCDHINHNGLDNRKANLRLATLAQNIRHRRKFKIPSRSGYKGVDWVARQRKWRARITINRRRIYLGSFKNQIQAAEAYDKAAEKYHGRFAVLNFPSE